MKTEHGENLPTVTQLINGNQNCHLGSLASEPVFLLSLLYDLPHYFKGHVFLARQSLKNCVEIIGCTGVLRPTLANKSRTDKDKAKERPGKAGVSWTREMQSVHQNQQRVGESSSDGRDEDSEDAAGGQRVTRAGTQSGAQLKNT